MYLALSVVETTGAGPSIGAAVDGGVSISVANTREVFRHQIQGVIPTDRNERILSPISTRGIFLLLEKG